MKSIEVSQLNPEILHNAKETISIEDQGKLIGYFHPVGEKPDTEELWKHLDQALERAVAETGLDKETLINALDPNQPFPYEPSQSES